MPGSLRRLIGMITLVTFVVVYCFVAMVIGDMTMSGRHWGIQLIFFAIVGLIWTIPAGFIIKWMYKNPQR
ncbi:DUF2842 domain-containing protein [Pseudovibrio exalbescens]|uniref:DUF2842 domain-containing protein n=2 Tax=Pseudovibrio exalbescens TaxID=197461 RepID=A0A1U7JG07_9HYPH|nr:DUF2842 domain-containing protein [Pseudovibrio exalbescens]OKL43635.1 hypothetical protein A3843_13515 [Pseudovibrio exalbescens]